MAPHVRLETLLLLLLGLQTIGCTDPGTLPNPTPSVAQWISPVSGYYQEGIPGTPLSHPLVVWVSSNLGPAAGLRVSWQVVSGAGEFIPAATVVTDATGEARVEFRPATHRTEIWATVGLIAGPPARFFTVPRPLATYTRPDPDRCGDRCDRYVFYPDSTFSLIYPQTAGYTGVFTRNDAVLNLMFDADPYWIATGTFHGDSIRVVYNGHMSLSDFEDGLFLLEMAP